MDTVKCIKKWNHLILKPIWKTTVQTYKKLYQEFCGGNPDYTLSYGYFVEMKPFNIHHATQKDMVMCCCKIHLCAHWVIESIIKCLKYQDIIFPVSSYENFFKALYSNRQQEHIIHSIAYLTKKLFALIF